MKKISQYGRRLLLAVTGMSPAVVTETLFAIACRGTERFIPTEIHLITTRKGARDALQCLLHKELGYFHKLCNDYHLPSILFDRSTIHILTDGRGQPLEDVMSPDDNQYCADFIMDIVRQLTRDEDAALHVSIAGGRKTMGYYLGYMMSLFGRQQDRLSHVLVDTPYEQCENFFYPTPVSCVVTTPGGHSVDAKDCDIKLADIPFLRLRERLSHAGLDLSSRRFGEVIAYAQMANMACELTIDPGSGSIAIAGRVVKLSPLGLAFLLWRARRTVANIPVVRPSFDEETAIAHANGWTVLGGQPETRDEHRDAREWFRAYIEAVGDDPTEDWCVYKWHNNPTYRRIQHGLHASWWNDSRQAVSRYLMEAFKDRKLVEKYLPVKRKLVSGRSGFLLDISVEQIHIVEKEE